MTEQTINFGSDNTGNCNTGERNTGIRNTGNWNTGHRNAGDCNTGYRNTGKYNTGDYNTGNYNTGNYNTGNCNTGYWNAGRCNTGDFNTGHWNTGYCNSVTPDDCLIFNKPAKRKDWENAKIPNWMCAELTKWVDEAEMTDKEKEVYPSYVTTGGYLKCYSSLTAAHIDAWESASEDDRQLTRKLPNFDEKVFAEVFGFNPWQGDTPANPA